VEEYSRFSFNDAPLTALRAFGAVGVAALVIALSYYSIRGPREVVAVVPSPDGTKAAVLMANGGGELVMLVDKDAGNQWSASMPLQFRPDMVRGGASFEGDAITVRGFAVMDVSDREKLLAPPRTVRSWAFSTKDGSILWEGADSGLPMKQAMAPPYVSNLGDDKTLYEIHITKPHSVVGVDRATGKELLRVAIPEEWSDVDALVRAWLDPKWLILDQPNTFVFVDRATGQMHKLRARQWACVLGQSPGGAVYYEPEDDSALTRRSLDDLTDQRLFDLPGTLIGECGSRGNEVIFGIEDEYHGRLLAVDQASGQPAWTIELGTWSLDTPRSRDVRSSYATQAPLSGELPRFLPMPVADWNLHTNKDQAKYGIVMLDLDQRKIAWVADDPALADWELIRHGDAFYMFRGNQLVKLDPTTGNPAWAVKIDGAQTIQPYHFAGDELWLYSDRAVRVLDLANAHLHGGWGWAPIEARDIGPEIGKLLGGSPQAPQ
jgi:hypothetical protein